MDLEQYNYIIEEIKTYVNDNDDITDEEKQVFKDLLKVIKNNIQIDLMDQIIDNSDRLKAVSNLVDYNISRAEARLDIVTNKLIGHEHDYDLRYQLNTLKRILDRLNNIRRSILSKDIKEYTSSIVKNAKTGRELVNLCGASMALGYNDDPGIFGKNFFERGKGFDKTINEETFDRMFEILLDKPLFEELHRYTVEAMKKDKPIATRKLNKEKIRLYSNLMVNLKYIREYRDIIIRLHKTDNDNHYTQNPNYAEYTKKMEFVEKHNNPLGKLLYGNKIKTFEKDLENMVTVSDDVKKDRTRKSQLEAQFKKAGINEAVRYAMSDVYHRNALPSDDKVAEIIVGNELNSLFRFGGNDKSMVDDLGIKMNISKDIVDECTKKINKLNDNCTSIKNSLSPKAQALLEESAPSVRLIVNYSSEERKYGRKPLLCAYVVQAYAKSMNASLDELTDAVLEEDVLGRLQEDYTRTINEFIDRREQDITILNQQLDELFMTR